MQYKLDQAKVEVPEVPDLDDTERTILRGLTEPGGALWKIMRTMQDYADDLQLSLLTADLGNPDELRQAQKVQSTILAVIWTKNVFEAALTPQDKETASV